MTRNDLLVFLESEANKKGIVRLTLREIAKEMKVSHQWVKVVLGELEAFGLLERKEIKALKKSGKGVKVEKVIEITKDGKTRNVIKIL